MIACVRLAALLAVLVPIVVPAQETSSAPSSEKQAAPGGSPMAAWNPRKPTAAQEKTARQEIKGLFDKMEQGNKKGDLDAVAALIDFPVLMLTDTKAGSAVGGPWTEEEWRKRMAPMFQQPMQGMRMTHAPKVAVLTPALASVTDDWTFTMGKTKKSGRSAMLLVRKDGAWKVKSMVEGGWGDMKPPEGATAQEPSGATK
jgi:uncharacterized protein (TIGR02246 family)